MNENILAKAVIDAVPSVEMVRFTNSGTEACMGMLRLVRAYTKRDMVIKFDGCYHGHADGFLVQAGSGVATLGLPDSPGVPQGATSGTLVATYNDLASVEALLKEHEVAAVILEPVVGNSGFIPPTKEFLEVGGRPSRACRPSARPCQRARVVPPHSSHLPLSKRRGARARAYAGPALYDDRVRRAARFR